MSVAEQAGKRAEKNNPEQFAQVWQRPSKAVK
jgi:hypothetical protein